MANSKQRHLTSTMAYTDEFLRQVKEPYVSSSSNLNRETLPLPSGDNSLLNLSLSPHLYLSICHYLFHSFFILISLPTHTLFLHQKNSSDTCSKFASNTKCQQCQFIVFVVVLRGNTSWCAPILKGARGV